MHVSLPEDIKEQSLAAGFADVEQYVYSLFQRDRERLAIQEGIDALKDGRAEDFDQFDREFRQRNGFVTTDKICWTAATSATKRQHDSLGTDLCGGPKPITKSSA